MDKRLSRLLLVLVTLALVVACGGGGGGTTPTPTPTPGSTPQAGATPGGTEQPAWEARWEQTIAAAQGEGKVVVTSCAGAARRDAMTQGFEQAFPGITVEHVAMNSRDLWPRVVREAQLGQHNFDVRIGGADTTTFAAIANNNTHMPIDFDEWFILPEVRDPDVWLGGIDWGWLDEGEQYAWSIITNKSQSEGFWVNRNIIPESELSSVAQLSDPKWKGKIASISAEGGSAQNTMLMQMIELGEDWLVDFLANEPVLTRDHRQQIEWLIRGQYPIATTIDTTVLEDFRTQGLDISHLEPLPDQARSLSNGCESLQLHSNMPHPNAAKVYVNWLLSREHQAFFAERLSGNSRRLDVPPGDPAQVTTEEDLQNPDLYHSQAQFLDPYRERFVELVTGVLIQ